MEKKGKFSVRSYERRRTARRKSVTLNWGAVQLIDLILRRAGRGKKSAGAEKSPRIAKKAWRQKKKEEPSPGKGSQKRVPKTPSSDCNGGKTKQK